MSVLPLSTTYAFCEAFGFERGLNHSIREAPVFYGIYGAIVVMSVVIVMIPGIPLFPLMWLSQSLNALLLPVILILLLKLSNNAQLMGEWKNNRLQNVFASSLVVLISLLSIALLVTSIVEIF